MWEEELPTRSDASSWRALGVALWRQAMRAAAARFGGRQAIEVQSDAAKAFGDLLRSTVWDRAVHVPREWGTRIPACDLAALALHRRVG